MNNLSPFHLTPEQRAQVSVEDRCQEALERAREAIALAEAVFRLSVLMAANAVNDELDHLPNVQARCKALIQPEAIGEALEAINQAMGDLTYDAINALSREAGE